MSIASDTFRTRPADSHFRGAFDCSLSDEEFNRLCGFIHEHCGIKLASTKKTLLEGRLRKRLNTLEISSFKEYCRYLFSDRGMAHELSQMIDMVTTNKTDFFREPWHFEYMTDKALPLLIKKYGGGKKYRIWSSACSTGEEPYTIAIVLNEFMEKQTGFNYTVLATDISSQVLDKAEAGIYEHERINPVPLHLRKKYLLKSKDPVNRMVRVGPELRTRVHFRHLNLIDGDFGISDPIDIIFCRNVVIYFDKPTQEKLINRFYNHLIPGGYLFMGHSETLTGLNTPFAYDAATIYRKP